MGAAPQRRRLDPVARRELLLDAAEEIFVARGFAQSGLAEVADAAGVSKTLLYHYFPDGRPELYRAVVSRLSSAAVDELAASARAPVSAERRLTLFVDALIGFFERHPAAYRLVILEPWGTGDPGVVGQATAVRARMASELTGVLATAGQPLVTTTAAATAALGALLALCEQRVMGSLSGEQARAIGEGLTRDGLRGLGLV